MECLKHREFILYVSFWQYTAIWSSIGPVVVKVVSVWLVTFDCQNSALFIFVKVARMMISHNNSFHSSGTDDSHGLDSFWSTSFLESIIFLSFPIKSTNKWTLKDIFHSQGSNIVHAILNIYNFMYMFHIILNIKLILSKKALIQRSIQACVMLALSWFKVNFVNEINVVYIVWYKLSDIMTIFPFFL